MDEIFFLCKEGELKIIGSKDKLQNDKNCSESRFSITVFRVRNASGVNGPVIFPERVTKVHPRLRGNNFVTRYRFPKGSCVIPNKASYMDGETWERW